MTFDALAVRVLPRRPRRGEDLLDSHRTHGTTEVRAIDLVSVSDDIFRRSCSSTRNTYRMRNVAVGTTKKSMETRPLAWFRRRGMYRDTVASETLKPSMSNSPWMRGAPQVGFSRIRACGELVHRRESATQNARSALVSLGRLVVRFRMASCCRKARFSIASSRCGRRLDLAVASRAHKR
jgi:hypothetical protein